MTVLFLFSQVASARTACVAAINCEYTTLAAALTDTANPADVIEILGGQHVGPFVALWDVTLRGIGAVTLTTGASPILEAAGMDLDLESLTLDGQGLYRLLQVTSADVTLLNTHLTNGACDTDAAVAIRSAGQVEMTGGSLVGTRHTSFDALFISSATRAEFNNVLFADNDAPVAHVRADDVTLDGVVVQDSAAVQLWSAVTIYNASRVRVDRSWFCNNGGGAIKLLGGCDQCEFDHTVFVDNWSDIADQGAVVAQFLYNPLSIANSTFMGNAGVTAADISAVAGSGVVVDRSLFVGPSLVPSLFENGGPIVVTDSAFWPANLTTPAIGNEQLQAAPVFLPGFVPPACGPSMILDPIWPANQILTRWPDWLNADAMGALTTRDCGPWCLDADADGVPAMWDCDDADPGVGLDCATTSTEPTTELQPDEPTVWGPRQDQVPCWVDQDRDGYALVTDAECVSPLPVGDCDDGDPSLGAAPCALRLSGGRCAMVGSGSPTLVLLVLPFLGLRRRYGAAMW